MKVIIVPQGGAGSPYITSLTDSLQEAELDVCLARNHRFVLWQAVREYGRPAVIHVQWQHTHFLASNYGKAFIRAFIFYVQLLFLRLRGVRFVWTVHNYMSHERAHVRWELWTRRLLARLVHRLIVHCEVASVLIGEGYHVPRKKICVVEHGNFVDFYGEMVAQDVAREQLDIPLDARVFLFFGQIRPYKGVENLLTAFSQLKDPRSRLFITGSIKFAPLEETLNQMAKEDPRILLRLGFVPDEDVAKILAAGDVVVLPYHRTLTSGAAILAMSYGRSVIVPKMGCVQELSSDMAIHYDPEQADGLQNALLAAETAPLASMGQTAYRFAQRSSWSLIAEKTINVYYAAVQKSTVANVVRQTAPIATQSDYTGEQS